MYRGVSYQAKTMEQIEKNLREASAYTDHMCRAFLENGDAFALDATTFMKITRMIHQFLPGTETIAWNMSH